MNHPHDDSDPIEHDPTGMRALLGSLPDPGPMPDGLVARISAALADEARAGDGSSGGVRVAADGADDGWAPPECPPELRAGEGPVTTADVPAVGVGAGRAAAGRSGRSASSSGSGDGVVVPLHRRRTVRVLAAAAAVIGVLGAGGLVIETTRPGGLQAALGIAGSGSNDASAGGAADSASAADAPDAARAPAGVVASDPGLHVQVLAAGGSIAAADLADYAAGLDTTGRSGAVPAPPAQEGSAGAVTRPAGARDCATGLGVPTSDAVAVQPLVVDGRPAAVVVATSSSGARTAWAVDPACSAADPGVLSGPVPLP